MWYVYIIECHNNTFYTGICKDLNKRFEDHCSGKGAKYTKINKPKQLVYWEEQKDRSEASKREYQIKKLTKLQKIQLIKSKTHIKESNIMKKYSLLAIMVLASAGSAHAAQIYKPGNLLVGFGIGAGTSSIAPLGAAQLALSPSVELILQTWNPKGIGIAVGMTVDSSVNLFGSGMTGTLAVMPTVHVTLAEFVDWYGSLGLGLQLLPAKGTSGSYNIHVGFQTGFNFKVHPAWFISTGIELHANQFFGTVGFKIRFGDASKIAYQK